MSSSVPNRFERFLKKHNHILTYLGALIVFSTFIVKEGLREHWQDVAEAIERVRYIYTLRSDISGNTSNTSRLMRRAQHPPPAKKLAGPWQAA